MRSTEFFNKLTSKWEEVNFENLKIGDIFRIFENGKRYTNRAGGNNVWIATGDAYLNQDKIWQINTLY